MDWIKLGILAALILGVGILSHFMTASSANQAQEQIKQVVLNQKEQHKKEVDKLQEKTESFAGKPRDHTEVSTDNLVTQIVSRPDGRVLLEHYLRAEKGEPATGRGLTSRSWSDISEQEVKDIAAEHGIDLESLKVTPPEFLRTLKRLQEFVQERKKFEDEVTQLKSQLAKVTSGEIKESEEEVNNLLNKLIDLQDQLLKATQKEKEAEAELQAVKHELDYEKKSKEDLLKIKEQLEKARQEQEKRPQEEKETETKEESTTSPPRLPPLPEEEK